MADALVGMAELWLRPDHMGFGSDPLLDLSQQTSLANLVEGPYWALWPSFSLGATYSSSGKSLPATYQGERLHVIHGGSILNWLA